MKMEVDEYQAVLQSVQIQWGLEFQCLELLRQGVNRTYRATDSKQQHYIVRIGYENLRPFVDVQAELEWVIFLLGKNYPTRKPLEALDGHFCHSFVYNGQQLNIVCFAELPGKPFTKNSKFWSVSGWQVIGGLIGQLHALNLDFVPREERYSWAQEPAVLRFLNQPFSSDEKIFRDAIQANMDFLQTVSIQKNYGLIHHDFKGDNLIEYDNALFVIDFDSCCYNWYLCDLLMPIYYYFLYPRFNKENNATLDDLRIFVKNLVFGYQGEKDFPLEQVKYLDYFLRQLDVLYYATINLLKHNLMVRGTNFDVETTERILKNRILNDKTAKERHFEAELKQLLSQVNVK